MSTADKGSWLFLTLSLFPLQPGQAAGFRAVHRGDNGAVRRPGDRQVSGALSTASSPITQLACFSYLFPYLFFNTIRVPPTTLTCTERVTVVYHTMYLYLGRVKVCFAAAVHTAHRLKQSVIYIDTTGGLSASRLLQMLQVQTDHVEEQVI